MKTHYVIAGIFIAGLVIYFYTRTKVTGTIIAGGPDVVVTPSNGTVSYGTELQGS